MNPKSLVDDKFDVTNFDKLEFHPIVRKSSKGEKVIGWGIYLLQGSNEEPTEYFIPYQDIECFVDGLMKAKKMIEDHCEKIGTRIPRIRKDCP